MVSLLILLLRHVPRSVVLSRDVRFLFIFYVFASDDTCAVLYHYTYRLDTYVALFTDACCRKRSSQDQALNVKPI